MTDISAPPIGKERPAQISGAQYEKIAIRRALHTVNGDENGSVAPFSSSTVSGDARGGKPR